MILKKLSVMLTSFLLAFTVVVPTTVIAEKEKGIDSVEVDDLKMLEAVEGMDRFDENNYARVFRTENTGEKRFGLIDREGNLILPMEYNHIELLNPYYYKVNKTIVERQLDYSDGETVIVEKQSLREGLFSISEKSLVLEPIYSPFGNFQPNDTLILYSTYWDVENGEEMLKGNTACFHVEENGQLTALLETDFQVTNYCPFWGVNEYTYYDGNTEKTLFINEIGQPLDVGDCTHLSYLSSDCYQGYRGYNEPSILLKAIIENNITVGYEPLGEITSSTFKPIQLCVVRDNAAGIYHLQQNRWLLNPEDSAYSAIIGYDFNGNNKFKVQGHDGKVGYAEIRKEDSQETLTELVEPQYDSISLDYDDLILKGINGDQCEYYYRKNDGFQKWIEENAEVRSISRLTEDVFQIFFGSKTALVILDKEAENSIPIHQNAQGELEGTGLIHQGEFVIYSLNSKNYQAETSDSYQILGYENHAAKTIAEGSKPLIKAAFEDNEVYYSEDKVTFSTDQGSVVFESVQDLSAFNTAGLAQIQIQDHVGIVDRWGNYRLPAEYDSIQGLNSVRVITAEKDQRQYCYAVDGNTVTLVGEEQGYLHVYRNRESEIIIGKKINQKFEVISVNEETGRLHDLIGEADYISNEIDGRILVVNQGQGQLIDVTTGIEIEIVDLEALTPVTQENTELLLGIFFQNEQGEIFTLDGDQLYPLNTKASVIYAGYGYYYVNGTLVDLSGFNLGIGEMPKISLAFDGLYLSQTILRKDHSFSEIQIDDAANVQDIGEDRIVAKAQGRNNSLVVLDRQGQALMNDQEREFHSFFGSNEKGIIATDSGNQRLLYLKNPDTNLYEKQGILEIFGDFLVVNQNGQGQLYSDQLDLLLNKDTEITKVIAQNLVEVQCGEQAELYRYDEGRLTLVTNGSALATPETDYWGYLTVKLDDKVGKLKGDQLILAPEYDQIVLDPSDPGYYVASKNGKSYLYNTAFELLGDANGYDEIVKTNDAGYLNLINHYDGYSLMGIVHGETGKGIPEAKYKSAVLSQDKDVFYIEDYVDKRTTPHLYGVADLDGNILFEPVYLPSVQKSTAANQYGLYQITKGVGDWEPISPTMYRKRQRMGFMNRDYEVVVPPEYAYFFSINEDGLMIAAKRANDDYAEIPYYGVIDKQGTTILEAEYTRLNDQDLEFGGDNTLHLSSHGLSTMTLNQQGQELTGVFNKERIVLPAQYKKVKINEETISALREDNQWEIYTPEGSLITTISSLDDEDYSNVILTQDKLIVVNETVTDFGTQIDYGLADQDGTILLPAAYSQISYQDEKWHLEKYDETTNTILKAVMSDTGEVIIPFDNGYDEIGEYVEGFVIARQGSKETAARFSATNLFFTPINAANYHLNILDSKGAAVGNLDEYESAQLLGGQQIAVRKNGKYYIAKLIIEEKEEKAIESIQLSQSQLQLEINQSAQLSFSVTPEDATEQMTTVWQSSDPNVASVDEQGKVCALAQGQTTITLQVNGHQATCTVNVSKKAADSPSVPQSSQTEESITSSVPWSIPEPAAGKGNKASSQIQNNPETTLEKSAEPQDFFTSLNGWDEATEAEKNSLKNDFEAYLSERKYDVHSLDPNSLETLQTFAEKAYPLKLEVSKEGLPVQIKGLFANVDLESLVKGLKLEYQFIAQEGTLNEVQIDETKYPSAWTFHLHFMLKEGQEEIKKLTYPMTISLPTPDFAKGKGDFVIIPLSDSNAEAIPVQFHANGSFSFETNQLGNFALVEKQELTKSEDHSSNVGLIGLSGLLGIAFVGVILLIIKRRFKQKQ